MWIVAFLANMHILAVLELALSVVKIPANFSPTVSGAPRCRWLHRRCHGHMGQLVAQCEGMRANWARRTPMSLAQAVLATGYCLCSPSEGLIVEAGVGSRPI